jgi:transcription antitermination protein NusB
MISHSLPSLKQGNATHTPQKSIDTKNMTRGGRRLSRECVVQGLYTWLVNYENDASAIVSPQIVEAYLRGGDEYAHCDIDLFKQLLYGVIEHIAVLRDVFSKHIDRKPTDLSPVEHSLLLLGTYELMFCLETPLRVVINEAVEVSKLYGGNDAYKYINGVLDKVATGARPVEFAQFLEHKASKKQHPSTYKNK